MRHCTGKHRAGPHAYLHRHLQNNVTSALEGLTRPSKYVEARMTKRIPVPGWQQDLETRVQG